MPSLRLISSLFLLATITACGGAQPAAEAPATKADGTAPAPPPPAPLPGQAPPRAGYGQVPAPAPTSDAEAAEDPFRIEQEAASVEEAQRQLETLEAALTGTLAAELASGRCERACRALASMERSAERLCELAGADDERCASARERLDESTARVSDAGCGC